MNVSKETGPVMGTNGNEIGSVAAVIPPGCPAGCNAVFVIEFFHTILIKLMDNPGLSPVVTGIIRLLYGWKKNRKRKKKPFF